MKSDLASLIVGALIGAIFVYGITSAIYRHNAIKQGCAHYDPSNGVFTWNQP